MGLAAFNRMRRQKAEQEAQERPAEQAEPQTTERPAKAKKPAKAKE